MILDKFEKYYLGTPTIDRVIVRSFDALRTSWASLLRGELDMVYDVPADTVQFVRNEDVEVVEVASLVSVSIGVQFAPGAIEITARAEGTQSCYRPTRPLKRVLHGSGDPATGPSVSEILGLRLNTAALSARSDRSRGTPGCRRLSGSTNHGHRRAERASPLHLSATAEFCVWERIALEVQRDLFDIGVDMQFKVVPFEEFNKLVRRGQFEAVFFDMISGPTPAGRIFGGDRRRSSRDIQRVRLRESRSRAPV